MKKFNYNIGDIYENNVGQKYEILYEDGRTNSGGIKYRIRFLNTGYERTIDKAEIRRGKIKDKYAVSVYNIGCLGNVKMLDFKKEYNIWSGILERCYDKQSLSYKSYGEKGVTICDRWKCFQYFIEDISKIDGYNEQMFKDGLIFLDKDKKQKHLPHNKRVYSLETCCFLSFEENNLFRDNEHRKHIFTAISPNGETFKVKGLKQFARDNNLIRQGIYNCLNNKAKSHKGWTFHY